MQGRDYNFKGRRLGFNGYSDELKEECGTLENGLRKIFEQWKERKKK